MPHGQNSGAIALVGSGEYSLPMLELETQLLHRAISQGKRNTFIQIPTASSHEGDSSREKWKRLGQEQSDRIGSECIYLPIHEREDAFNPEFVDLITDAGLIYFSGGDPRYGMQSLSNGRVVPHLLDARLARWHLAERLWEFDVPTTALVYNCFQISKSFLITTRCWAGYLIV